MNGLLIGRFQPFHLGHLDALNFLSKKRSTTSLMDNSLIGMGFSSWLDKDLRDNVITMVSYTIIGVRKLRTRIANCGIS